MKKASPTLIGVFVLGAVVLILAGVVIFGSGAFFQKRSKIIMYFQGSVNGLSVGAPVKFKGVPIGQVAGIRLVINQKEDIVAIPVIADIDEGKLSTELGTDVDLDHDTIQRFVRAGLSATLESQSLVTGLLFVGLDLKPDRQATTLPIKSSYPQVPTLPSTLEQFSDTLSEVLKQVREVDLAKLMDGVTKTVDGLQRIVNSPEIEDTLQQLDATLHATRQLAEQLNRSIGPVTDNVAKAAEEANRVLKSLEKTVSTANEILQPEAPLVYQLERAIKDVGEAARAVRQLAELLDEQPTVLLYGKDPGKQP